MKYKIANNLKKIFLTLYIVMTVISSYCINQVPVMAVKQEEDKDELEKVLFIGDSRLGGTVKTELENEGATVCQADGSKPSDWESVCSSGSGTVSGKSISLPEKKNVKIVAVDLGVNDTNSFESYKKVIENLQSRYSKTTIYGMSIYYCGSNRDKYADINYDIDTYNKKIKNYCDNETTFYADVNRGLQTDTKMKDDYQDKSGIHLNEKGIPVFVENIKNKIKKQGSNKNNYDPSVDGHYVANCGHHADPEGDQEGNEYWIREYYPPDPGVWNGGAWRYPDEDVAMEIAGLATDAAKNDCIGYCQDRRKTFLTQVAQVDYNPADITIDCDSDCSASTQTVILCAGHHFDIDAIIATEPPESDPNGLFTTDNEASVLESMGFEKVVDAPGDGDWTLLEPGDIIFWDDDTPTGGHSTIYIGNGTAGSGITGYDSDSIDLDKANSGLKYKGLPSTMTYSGSKSIPNIFELIKGLLDWIVGLIFLGLKVVIMGYTELVENIISDLLHDIQNVKITY